MPARKPATPKTAQTPKPVNPPPTGPLPPGSVAPDFALASSEGNTVRLDDLRGRTVVLFFYPKADTPGCTKQACGFSDAMAGFSKAGVVVLGVSPDPQTAVAKFSGRYSFRFPLLADPDHRVCDAYGVWTEKSMYGRRYWGAARTTFVIAPDGRIAHVFEKVKPEGHDAEVLAWLRSRS